VLVCGEDNFVRSFLLAAHQMSMTSGNFVFLLTSELPPENFRTPWLRNDSMDIAAKAAYAFALQVRQERYRKYNVGVYFNRY